jgi:HK97 family phage portal protein
MFNLVKRASANQWEAGAGLSLSDLDRVMDSQYNGQPVFTGGNVSQSTSLAVSAIWACIDRYGKDLATTPLLTYQRTKAGRERYPEHYLWPLFTLQANPELSSWRFVQLMQTWVLLWGNAYAELEINGRGQVMAMWPWRPDRTRVERAYPGGPLQYRFKMPDGQWSKPVPSDRMFHLRGMGTDGVLGLSPIEVHKQTVGLSLAITEYGARTFGNGSRPGGILTTDQAVNDKSFERLQKSWNDQHGGLTNAHRVAILEMGLKWQATDANLVDIAYIDSHKVTNLDVCRMFGMPPHKIGISDGGGAKTVEESNIDYVISSLMPWTANWQNQIHCDCLSKRENDTVFTAFNFRNLLRGNHQAMAQFLAALNDRGLLNADESRGEFLDLNELPDGLGKIYYRATNMGPITGEEGANSLTSPANMQTVAPVKKAPPKDAMNGHAALQ